MSRDKAKDDKEIKILSHEANFKMAIQKLENLEKIQGLKELLHFIAGELVLLNQKVENL